MAGVCLFRVFYLPFCSYPSTHLSLFLFSLCIPSILLSHYSSSLFTLLELCKRLDAHLFLLERRKEDTIGQNVALS